MARNRRTGRSIPASERGQLPTTPSSVDPLDGLFPAADLFPLSRPAVVTPPTAPRALTEPFDGRLWHPRGRSRPAPLVDGSNAVLDPSNLASLSSFPSFEAPDRVVHCIRRKQRREVLFAKGKGGKGYRSRKRRSWRSNFGCS